MQTVQVHTYVKSHSFEGNKTRDVSVARVPIAGEIIGLGGQAYLVELVHLIGNENDDTLAYMAEVWAVLVDLSKVKRDRLSAHPQVTPEEVKRYFSQGTIIE